MQWFPDLASSPDRKVCGYLANKVTDATAKEELRSLAKVPPVCHEAKMKVTQNLIEGHFTTHIRW